MEFEEPSEGHETGGVLRPDDMNTGTEVENSLKRSRRWDGSRRNLAKRSRSPEIWTRRGRGRADRPDVVCLTSEFVQTRYFDWFIVTFA